jgi:HrpA-like RNA helicase
MPPTLLVPGNLVQPDLPDAIPIKYIVQTYLDMVNTAPRIDNPFTQRLILLESQTASGKSTTVPPSIFFAHQQLVPNTSKTVICTQPRVLTATEITDSLHNAPYFGPGRLLIKGENLGLKTGTFSQPFPRSGLLISSLGSFEQTLTTMNIDQFCNKYACIIIDEAHERQLLFDTTISKLKALYEKNGARSDLPVVILMSATFDIESYAKFFGIDPTSRNVIKVRGQPFPIEERWPSQSTENIYLGATNAILKCIREEVGQIKERGTHTSKNRILVFVPGRADSKSLLREITASHLITGLDVEGVRVYADYRYVDGEGVRKVSSDYLKIRGNADQDVLNIAIIAVNAVAETGLTLNDLRYVIDCGWSKELECCPSKNISDVLISKPAARSRIMQRRGRVGRTKPGVFIPLYTKSTFDALIKIQIPEIMMRDPLEPLLSVICIYGSMRSADELKKLLLDVPTQPAIDFALHKLQLLGMIDSHLKVTPMGITANKLTSTIPIESITMIFAGFKWGVNIDDLIVIAVMMMSTTDKDSPIGFSSDTLDALRKKMADRSISRDQANRIREDLMRKLPTPLECELIYSTLFSNQSGSIYYPFRSYVADDFIEQIVTFRAFEIKFRELFTSTSNPSQNYQLMQKWADKCFINLPNMLDTYERYVSVKNKLCVSGVDIGPPTFHPSTQSFITHAQGCGQVTPQLHDYVTRLKLCIYYGFKLNLAVRQDNGSYRMNWGGQSFNYSFFGSDSVWKKYEAAYNYAPQRILFYKARVMSINKVYRLYVLGVSVLDGYV